MKNTNFAATSVLVVAVLASTGADAAETPPHNFQQQLAQNMSSEERTALREQLGNRMRESSPAEQALMRGSAYDGKQQMENRETARTEQNSGRNEGYGRGHESRQGRGMGGGRGR